MRRIESWPNILTLLRVLLVPIFVLIYYLPAYRGHFVSACIFAIAAITDWLDGYLARSLKQASAFGAFLDPVADKLMVSVALVVLVAQPYVSYLTFAAAVIVGREIVVSGLREWMAEIGKRASIAVNLIAKFKTGMQMVAITVLIYYSPKTSMWWLGAGGILLYVAATLTLCSMFMYLKTSWPDLNWDVHNK